MKLSEIWKERRDYTPGNILLPQDLHGDADIIPKRTTENREYSLHSPTLLNTHPHTKLLPPPHTHANIITNFLFNLPKYILEKKRRKISPGYLV